MRDDRTPAEYLERGVVNIDKPAGPTSHEVADWVKRMTGVSKAAHTGTLDPRVTGCLPVLLGRSARVTELFLGAPKEYVFVLELHGEAAAEELFDEFEGEIYQRPPVKSSVGRRLRTREIHELELLERDGRRVLGRVSCEAGTYVRKLCHDIGLASGAGGHMAELRRISTGPFEVEDSVYLHDLADALALGREGDVSALRESVEPIESALGSFPRVTVKDSAVDAVAHGAPLYAPGVVGSEASEGETAVVFSSSGDAVCVGEFVGDSEEGVVLEPDHVLVEPGEYPHGW